MGRTKLVRIPQASLVITNKTELECSSLSLNETSQLGKHLFKLPYKYAFDSFFLNLRNQEDASSSAKSHSHKTGTNILPSETTLWQAMLSDVLHN